jgi:hypothetical protein
MKQLILDAIDLQINNELSKVQDSFPSIYTKDDVKRLVSSLWNKLVADIEEIDRTTPHVVTSEQDIIQIKTEAINEFVEQLKNDIENIEFNGSDIIDYDSAEFEIDYRNTITLQSVDLCCNDQINSDITECIEKNAKEFIKDLSIENAI